MGSDAHAPEQVGLRFDEVYGQLRDKDIVSVISFDKRQSSEILIDNFDSSSISKWPK